MTRQQEALREKLKQLGYAQDNRIRLYGTDFELRSDPIVVADHLAFVDAIEEKSGRLRRVSIPLTILRMAGRPAA